MAEHVERKRELSDPGVAGRTSWLHFFLVALLIFGLSTIGLKVLPAMGNLVSELRAGGAPESSATSTIRELKGTLMPLPAKDELGKPVPKGARTLLILPGCNSCTISSSGEVKLNDVQDVDICITPDRADVQRFEQLVKRARGRWSLLIDTEQTLVPRSLYDVAAILVYLDAEGKVVGGRKCR